MQPTAGGRDADTEERILRAASTVFLRRGTHGARMQEIADEAGVNKALLHYYFRSKDRLAEEVFRRAFGRLMPTILQVLGSDLPVEEKVARVVREELTVLSENLFLPGYVISEINQHPERIFQTVSALAPAPIDTLVRGVLDTLQRQIDEGVEAGTLRSIAAEHFVINLLSLCIFPFAARPMLALVLGMDEERFRAFIAARERELTDFFLHALRP